MTNPQMADLLDQAADAARAGDRKARSAIWRIAPTIQAAMDASEAFSTWLVEVGPGRPEAWTPGPIEEVGIRALRACAAWLRGEADAKPVPVKGLDKPTTVERGCRVALTAGPGTKGRSEVTR